MSATVVAYWPGMTEAQAEAQPGFYNDDAAWGNWMAERDGDNVTWVSPRALRDAAARLRDAVRAEAEGATQMTLEVNW